MIKLNACFADEAPAVFVSCGHDLMGLLSLNSAHNKNHRAMVFVLLSKRTSTNYL